MDTGEVDAKLSFAELRMRELLGLNGGDVAGAVADDRDRQTAEFFFHAVSATEVLAQYVNELKGLSLTPHLVSVRKVSDALGTGSPAGTAIGALYVNVGNTPFPTDPYTDTALIYRMLAYRNHTAHHRRAPFNIRMFERSVHLHLDPRDPARGGSRDPISDELPRILDVVRGGCAGVIALL